MQVECPRNPMISGIVVSDVDVWVVEGEIMSELRKTILETDKDFANYETMRVSNLNMFA